MLFSSDEKKLILIQSLYFFAVALADVFVTVFFFSHGSIETPVIFQIVRMCIFVVLFSLFGLAFRKFPSGTIMKMGLFTLAGFYFLLFFLKERSIAYLIPLSVINGVAIASFWSGFNLNQYILTNRKKRISYFGSTLISAQLFQSFAPFLGGVIITSAKSYASLEAGYGFLFLTYGIILSYSKCFHSSSVIFQIFRKLFMCFFNSSGSNKFVDFFCHPSFVHCIPRRKTS